MPIGNDRKAMLTALARAAEGGVLDTAQAAQVLGVSPREASRRLASLLRQGWLGRIKRGHYVILPLEARNAESTVPEDPWAVAIALFEPCYIGGWSAAEHWNLTEQIFRATFVATSANIRERDEVRMGISFHLAKVSQGRQADLTMVWRGRSRLSVSGPERTLVDGARNTGWVGGARQLFDMLAAYRERKDATEAALVEQLEKHGNGAAAKRLGFIAQERWPDAQLLIQKCHQLQTSGTIKLDPAVSAKGHLETRWGLWRNVKW